MLRQERYKTSTYFILSFKVLLTDLDDQFDRQAPAPTGPPPDNEATTNTPIVTTGTTTTTTTVKIPVSGKTCTEKITFPIKVNQLMRWNLRLISSCNTNTHK